MFLKFPNLQNMIDLNKKMNRPVSPRSKDLKVRQLKENPGPGPFREKQGYADRLGQISRGNKGTQINFAYFSKKTGVRR